MNERIDYKDGWSYQLFDDGYEIWGPMGEYITQHDPYGKVYKPDGTYEENCLIQLFTLVPEEEEKSEEA